MIEELFHKISLLLLMTRHTFANVLNCSEARFPLTWGGSANQDGSDVIFGVDINQRTNTFVGVGQFTDKAMARNMDGSINTNYYEGFDRN